MKLGAHKNLVSSLLQSLEKQHSSCAREFLFGRLRDHPITMVVDKEVSLRDWSPTTCFGKRYQLSARLGRPCFGKKGGRDAIKKMYTALFGAPFIKPPGFNLQRKMRRSRGRGRNTEHKPGFSHLGTISERRMIGRLRQIYRTWGSTTAQTCRSTPT